MSAQASDNIKKSIKQTIRQVWLSDIFKFFCEGTACFGVKRIAFTWLLVCCILFLIAPWLYNKMPYTPPTFDMDDGGRNNKQSSSDKAKDKDSSSSSSSTNVAILHTNFGFDLACPNGGPASNALCATVNDATRWEAETVADTLNTIERVKKGVSKDRDDAKVLIVDVGAHVGLFAFRMSDAAEKVVAVDASDANVAAMKRTISLNKNRVNNFKAITPVQAIVSEHSGETCKMYSSDKDVSDYLVECGSGSTSEKKSFMKDRGTASEQSSTLDQVLEKNIPTWRKFDVRVVKLDLGKNIGEIMEGGKKHIFGGFRVAPHIIITRMSGRRWRNSKLVTELFEHLHDNGFTVIFASNRSSVAPSLFSETAQLLVQNGETHTFYFVRHDVVAHVTCSEITGEIMLAGIFIIVLFLAFLYLVWVRTIAKSMKGNPLDGVDMNKFKPSGVKAGNKGDPRPDIIGGPTQAIENASG